ncbi:hypothetical protein [Streptomyces sp. DH37]|uniref:DUF6919 domain-containing protein n=1 Tax=Streptomyces sp. DH37 TaxID=3040122 RepID=UPI002441ADE4|nr:hypothetical protein [Streptomyces sp. DH37]MDG9701678.1 hypothetical protein [Streptomyces sp. DH37]
MRMPRTDRRTWATARTVADLGELTARWLEGRIGSQPGYVPNCGPDEETRELMPLLAAANRAGFLTTNSQPGCDGSGYDGRRWQQRAAVCGFAEPAVADRVRRAASRHGCRVVEDEVMPCTTRDGEIMTAFGGRMRRRDLAATWKPVSVDAYRAVLDARQLAVICPDWGPGGTRKLLAVLGALG